MNQLRKLLRNTFYSAVRNGVVRPSWLAILPPHYLGFMTVDVLSFSPLIRAYSGRPFKGFIFNPTDIPPKSRYHILEDEHHLKQSRGILQALAYGHCLGYADTESLKKNHANSHVVVASSKWPKVLANLQEAGIPRDRIWVFLPPLGNAWDYWSLLNREQNGFHSIESKGAQLSASCFRKHFESEGGAIYASNSVLAPKHRYLLNFPRVVQGASDKINEVAQNLSDESSKSLYKRLMSADPVWLLERFFSGMMSRSDYFDYVTIREGDVIINGGIAAGTELPRMLVSIGAFGRLYCFDPMGFDLLSGIARSTADYYSDRITMISQALWDKPGTVSFPVDHRREAIGGAPNRKLFGTQLVNFSCITIDSFVEENGINRLDYLKLDLEGAEPWALKGAERTLKILRPQLAVSIYHEVSHMWELPLYLMEMLQDYDHYVEHYSYTKGETILYCIPRERMRSVPGHATRE